MHAAVGIEWNNVTSGWFKIKLGVFQGNLNHLSCYVTHLTYLHVLV